MREERERKRGGLNLIMRTDSLISRLVNGDKTEFLKKLVKLKVIQVEGAHVPIERCSS